MKIGKCQDCSEAIVRLTGRCKPCWYKFNSGNNHVNWTGGRTCIKCSKKLKNRSKDTRQCFECYQKSRTKTLCLGCNKKMRDKSRKRCLECFGKQERGENNPSWKGGKPLCKQCGKNLSRYKGSITGFCQKCYRGVNTKNWNPNAIRDTSSSRNLHPENYEWRKRVYTRDNFQCKICGDKRGGNLVAHHLENYRDNISLRFEVGNGITLCESCHKAFHHQFGIRNTNSRQFVLFRTKQELGFLTTSLLCQ